MTSPPPDGRERIRLVLPHAAPVKRQPLPERIADELRTSIVLHGQPGNEVPRDQELSDRFGVSKPTAREALRILEVEGLVTVRRGIKGGAFVADLTLDAMARPFSVMLRRSQVSLRDVFVARQVIEPAAARMAAEHGTVDGLRSVVEHEALVLADGGDIVASEVAFHDALLDASGSTTLASLGRLLAMIVSKHAVDNMELYRRERAEEISAGFDAAHRAHVLIVDAIAAGDAETAEKRVGKHLHAVIADTLIDPDDLADIF